VTDTRNSYPGWAVSGQAADFTGSGTSAGAVIAGNQLGWAPTSAGLGGGVALAIPPAAAAGPYASGLTITAVTSQ
jgi:hypothetical protein